ncbi:MAG: zinc-binding alcohol dehydrogenase family protein [Tepidisphaeraceae bacterium]|jgi:NADPH:quinone reductase
MRAVVVHQFGDPGQLKVEERPMPEPAGEEVLVAVKAAAINPSDVKNVQGMMHGTTLPRIPGRDFAGVVVRGAGNIGREVWGTGGDIGFTRDGSHAQFILLSASAVTTKPAAISMEAAGGAGLTFVTAWLAMVTSAQVSCGETAVIIGAAGGVGSAAVQIAKSRGARVIAIVRSDDDFISSRQNGADEVINSKSANVINAVQSITKDGGAGVVFDSSGMMFAEAVEMAGMDGRIPVITAPADGKSSFNLRNVYRKELRVYGVDTRRLDAVACAKLLAQMANGFESGKLTAKPGKPFPIAAAVDAYQQAARGGVRITLRPDLGIEGNG